ncbi:MAG: exodeoxyribonuclease V subunit gamma [Succinivibrionaceae bacterium]|nr:exodeoxyribonuclease V subunit gamma [Succinivibrionaceae bacterium]
MSESTDSHLEIVASNDMGQLAGICACLMGRHPLSDPLARERVLVMNLGMETYLKQELARANGIMAQVEFLQPWTLIWELHKQVFPEADDTNRFDRAHLVYGLLGVLQDEALLRAPALAVARNYLEGDSDGRKALGLAQQLADVLDQYQMFRPEWVEAIDALAEAGEPDPARLPRAFKGSEWQALVYLAYRRRLSFVERDPLRVRRAQDEGEAGPQPLAGQRLALAQMDRAQILTNLTRSLLGEIPGCLGGLPERLIIFGCSSLPQAVLDLFGALSRHCRVYLMLFDPCREYWGDLMSSEREFRRRFTIGDGSALDVATQGRGSRTQGGGSRGQDPALFSEQDGERLEGNPLLLSLGRQGRDFLSLLLSMEPTPGFIGCFTEEGSGTMLGALRGQLLRLEYGAGGQKIPIAATDRSLEIHSCPTRRREVEALRDAILSTFLLDEQEGRPLAPRDIIVMVPTINDYAPLINAIFGSVPRDDPNYLPFGISDRSVESASPLANALLRLLSLAEQGLTASLALDLLAVPAIGARFGIAAEDLEVLSAWCGAVGIHWGLDGEDVGRALGFGMDMASTFESGAKALLEGCLLGEGAGLPFTDIEWGDAPLLGNFCAFIHELRRLRDTFASPLRQREPAAWQEFVTEEITSRFFKASGEALEELSAINSAIAGMVEVEGDFAERTALSLPAFRAGLEEALASRRSHQQFLNGAVNFCSLIPMRAVPFRHIFVLGLSDEAFPRRERAPGINLLMRPGQFRRGDRSRHADDRYLFLETLMSARDSLYLSYLGQDPSTQDERSPSPVVGELLDYLNDNFTVEGADPGQGDEASRAALLRRLVRVEHLMPYHPDNFVGESRPGLLPRLPSFDRRCLEGALGQGERREAALLGALGDYGLPSEPEVAATLEELCAFLRNPPLRFLSRSLGIRAGQRGGMAAGDDEPFALDFLSRAALLQSLVDDPKADGAALGALGRLGNFPQGRILSGLEREGIEADLASVRAAIAGLGDPGAEASFRERLTVLIPAEGREATLDLSGKVHQNMFIFSPYHTIRKPDRKFRDDHRQGHPPRPAALLLSALALGAAQALALGEGCRLTIIDRGGEKLKLLLPGKEVARERLAFLAAAYLCGARRPLPANPWLLQYPLMSDPGDLEIVGQDQVEGDLAKRPEFTYLFGSVQDLLGHEALCEAYQAFASFYFDALDTLIPSDDGQGDKA